MNVVAPAGGGMGSGGRRPNILRRVVGYGPLPSVGVIATGCVIGRANGPVRPNAGRNAVVKVRSAAACTAVVDVIAPRWVCVRSRNIGGAYRFDVAGSEANSVNVVLTAGETARPGIGGVARILRLLTAKCQPDVYVIVPAGRNPTTRISRSASRQRVNIGQLGRRIPTVPGRVDLLIPLAVLTCGDTSRR